MTSTNKLIENFPDWIIKNSHRSTAENIENILSQIKQTRRRYPNRDKLEYKKRTSELFDEYFSAIISQRYPLISSEVCDQSRYLTIKIKRAIDQPNIRSEKTFLRDDTTPNKKKLPHTYSPENLPTDAEFKKLLSKKFQITYANAEVSMLQAMGLDTRKEQINLTQILDKIPQETYNGRRILPLGSFKFYLMRFRLLAEYTSDLYTQRPAFEINSSVRRQGRKSLLHFYKTMSEIISTDSILTDIMQEKMRTYEPSTSMIWIPGANMFEGSMSIIKIKPVSTKSYALVLSYGYKPPKEYTGKSWSWKSFKHLISVETPI